MKRANYFTRHHILTCKELCGAETTGLTALSNSISYCHSHFTVFFVYFVCFTPRHITSHHVYNLPSHSRTPFPVRFVIICVCFRSLSLSFVVFRILSCFQRTPSYPPFLHFSLLTPTTAHPLTSLCLVPSSPSATASHHHTLPYSTAHRPRCTV